MRIYLSSHPDVFMPPGEVGFFSHRYSKGFDWYLSHFSSKASITGEKCAGYLSNSKAPKRILKHIPGTKFIVLLRNPVDRAWSHYRWAKSMGEEKKPFDLAILTGGDYGKKYGKDASYLSRGHYADQLERWFRFFPHDRFLVIKSEDMFIDPNSTYRQTLSFLELREHAIDGKKHGTVPATGSMGGAMRRFLSEHYEPHDRQLERLLGREFGWDD